MFLMSIVLMPCSQLILKNKEKVFHRINLSQRQETPHHLILGKSRRHKTSKSSFVLQVPSSHTTFFAFVHDALLSPPASFLIGRLVHIMLSIMWKLLEETKHPWWHRRGFIWIEILQWYLVFSDLQEEQQASALSIQRHSKLKTAPPSMSLISFVPGAPATNVRARWRGTDRQPLVNSAEQRLQRIRRWEDPVPSQPQRQRLTLCSWRWPCGMTSRREPIQSSRLSLVDCK